MLIKNEAKITIKKVFKNYSQQKEQLQLSSIGNLDSDRLGQVVYIVIFYNL